MNKLVAALSVSTAVCAAAALYFRHQLIEERMAVRPASESMQDELLLDLERYLRRKDQEAANKKP
ncbi:MAG TPA: hypothetical protein VGO61_12945 [Steroidobacteraceae bacterium]|nr:hypothetical protein [Steroidobacteraceae bacterium]